MAGDVETVRSGASVGFGAAVATRAAAVILVRGAVSAALIAPVLVLWCDREGQTCQFRITFHI